MQRGRYDLGSPETLLTAGTSMPRTMVASRKIATASPAPPANLLG